MAVVPTISLSDELTPLKEYHLESDSTIEDEHPTKTNGCLRSTGAGLSNVPASPLAAKYHPFPTVVANKHNNYSRTFSAYSTFATQFAADCPITSHLTNEPPTLNPLLAIASHQWFDRLFNTTPSYPANRTINSDQRQLSDSLAVTHSLGENNVSLTKDYVATTQICPIADAVQETAYRSRAPDSPTTNQEIYCGTDLSGTTVNASSGVIGSASYSFETNSRSLHATDADYKRKQHEQRLFEIPESFTKQNRSPQTQCESGIPFNQVHSNRLSYMFDSLHTGRQNQEVLVRKPAADATFRVDRTDSSYPSTQGLPTSEHCEQKLNPSLSTKGVNICLTRQTERSSYPIDHDLLTQSEFIVNRSNSYPYTVCNHSMNRDLHTLVNGHPDFQLERQKMDDDSSASSPVQIERQLVENYRENETATTVGSFESNDMKAGIYGNYSPDFPMKERDPFLLQNDVIINRAEHAADVDSNEGLTDVPIGFPSSNSIHSEWLDNRTCGAGLLHPNIVNGWNRSEGLPSNAFYPNDALTTAPQSIFSNFNNPYYFQHPLIHEQTDAFDQNTQVVHAYHTQVESYHPLDASLQSGVKYPPLLHYQSDLNSATATAMATSLQGQRNLHMLPSMGGFIPLTHNHQNLSPSFSSRSRISSSSLINQFGHRNITCNVVSVQPPEIDYNPRELEAFSERFKQRRIKLGVTQADVGKALGNLKIAGVGSLSQSTICRFESLTLSHNNMVALKPVLQAWLEEAEAEAAERQRHPEIYDPAEEEKRRKRTSITDSEKRSLEAFFSVQPRPSSEKIAQIAEKLNLKKNVVRVWFCNQRQKQKRMKFSTLGLLHHNANRT
ncbi:hypothetical protein EG68_01864 [Paragonimus skrjabini miyazakii]|uniref:POU domain protein n=1 Tax=Paragonimus skrjabini miyazakii TaxID=59628 RepID=A0A8S9Z6H5_9TREM|nr:hypothetical protein EG68_01864 [Paragonimus skrjabini miyazakii]